MFKLVRISLKTSTISSGAAVNIFPSSFTAPDTNIYQCLGFIVWDTYSQHLVPQCVSTFSFYARNVSSSSITVSASAYGILLYAKKTYVS